MINRTRINQVANASVSLSDNSGINHLQETPSEGRKTKSASNSGVGVKVPNYDQVVF